MAPNGDGAGDPPAPEDQRPRDTRFKPGQSGNPKGQTRTLKWVRSFLDKAPSRDDVALILGAGVEVPKSAMAELTHSRLELVARAMFLTAIDRAHPGHVNAAKTLLAYRFGRPPMAIEVSGPGGKPIQIDPLDAMTSEQKITAILELAAKAGATLPTGGDGSKPPNQE